MFNISCTTCITQYIGDKNLEDRTLSGWNGCLTPSHSITQPPDLGFWFSRSSLVFICFGQNVTRIASHVKYLVDCNQDPKLCNFFIYSINEENNSIMYLFFLFSFFFFYKKISGNSTPLTQKERCPKKHSKNLSF